MELFGHDFKLVGWPWVGAAKELGAGRVLDLGAWPAHLHHVQHAAAPLAHVAMQPQSARRSVPVASLDTC